MDSSTSRWCAPELMQPGLIGLSKVFTSTSTDVWSFGMLCLELMTGCQPYSDVDDDITVAINLSKWRLPPRPGPMVTEQGLTDDLWALMLKCWHKTPHQRPTMTEVKDEMKRIHDNFTAPSRPGDIICLCLRFIALTCHQPGLLLSSLRSSQFRQLIQHPNYLLMHHLSFLLSSKRSAVRRVYKVQKRLRNQNAPLLPVASSIGSGDRLSNPRPSKATSFLRQNRQSVDHLQF